MTTTSKASKKLEGSEPHRIDPVALLKGLVSLRRLTGLYPAGHPAIEQKLAELDDSVQRHIRSATTLRIDVIHGSAHLDGVPFRQDSEAQSQILRELTDLGIDSIHFGPGVVRAELLALSEFLWQLKEAPIGEPIDVQLAARQIQHISLGHLVPLDTRWKTVQWPDAPSGTLDPSYELSLALTERTFDDVMSGKGIDLATIRDIVHLLIQKVAASNAALGQILAVKLYENLTYCHSVNVATLSLLIGRQLGFDQAATAALAEAALLHDIGKTRIPLEILKKPSALDKRERRMMEAHTTYGAEILVEVDGLRPLTPTVALEHHRGVKGTGYPDLGNAIPHPMSQIVSVADIYEAITGARTYQAPTPPDRACLILARMAGEKLNTGLVKTFVNAITFFPLGSLVRTNRNELGLVVQTNRREPLHPVLTLVDEDTYQPIGHVDTSERESAGGYARHIMQSLPAPDGLDLRVFLEPAQAAA